MNLTQLPIMQHVMDELKIDVSKSRWMRKKDSYNSIQVVDKASLFIGRLFYAASFNETIREFSDGALHVTLLIDT